MSAGLVLMSVMMMRWNVVSGGQEISKTGQGLLNYHMVVFHKEPVNQITVDVLNRSRMEVKM
ncbi:MAG: hypothetical protein HY322_03120 [Betaproteobacteria bacterium]|nr:hypothetical protein [Betaproteobacteria bacterium]